MFAIVCLSFVLGTLCYFVFREIKARHYYFKERGIPSPPFQLIFGHLRTIWAASSKTQQYQLWTKEYGPIYGIYEGNRPLYIVSDPDFLEDVYVRQFSSFNSRHLPFILREASNNRPSLFSATGTHWQRQRQVINPAFTSAKLKLMVPMIHRCIESLLTKVKENYENAQDLDIYTLYKRLTMDVICHCMFGVNSDMQNDIQNEYFTKAEETVAYNFENNFLVRISLIIPSLIPLLNYIMAGQVIIERFIGKITGNVQEMPRFWLMKRLQHLIDERTSNLSKNMNNRRVDLLQSMIDVVKHDDDAGPSDIATISKFIYYEEVNHNMLSLMIAGYETTATTLAYCTYILSKEQTVQKKLQSEFDSYDENEDEYDQVHNMIYLDWFIREVLRMFPPAPQAMSRLCNRTTMVCGHMIDEGSVIQPDLLSLHYDPDIWGPDDPHTFIPERHSVDRPIAALMGFGLGPRNCIGQRFALMEVKMCLARLLRQYTIYPGDQMEANFQLIDTTFIRHPKNVYVKIMNR